MKSKTDLTDLVCLECGNIFSIQRRVCNLKQTGHIKHLWCPICQKVLPHYEVHDVTKFMWELCDKPNLTKDERKLLYLLKERNKDESSQRISQKISKRK